MNLRTLTLATTSLVAIGLAVAPASAKGMMGDLNLGYEHTWLEVGDGGQGFDESYPAIIGAGRVNLPYSDTVNIQLDVIGRASMDKVFGDKSGHFALGGHINHRDNQGLLGVFVGTGRVSDDFFFSETVFTAGIEGQYFCDQWSLLGQMGYMDSEGFTLLQNAGFIQLGGNYYASKVLKIAANLAYIDGEVFDTDVTQWGWSIGAHYWFGKSIPVSGFVEYRGRTVDAGSIDLDENAINFGLTFHFGGDGFQDADRNGASANLPDFNWYRVVGND
ncbi:MAG: hypothetical protein KBA31_13985 [Alphaproteobacteria bacterium]|nr:hypothetical protein [Alphaproteobacteria bacterium]